MTNPLFNELAQFSRQKLKPTETKISYLNGRTFIRSSENKEEREIVTEAGETTASNESGVIYWSRTLGYLVDLVPDLSIDEIIPRLFLSGDDVASNREILRSKKITHVLNLTSNVPNIFEKDGIYYKKILIYDLPTQDIQQFFIEANEFIDVALENEANSVLIHCNAGISRSASFAISYLIQKNVCSSFNEALEFVKSRRSKIAPNEGFRKQLQDFEKKINGKK